MKKEIEYFDVPSIKSVQDMVLRSTEVFSDKLALEDLNSTPVPKLSYGDLLDNILRFGNAIRKLGMKERSHFAVIGENRVQWMLAYLTGLCFNYVIVPIDKNLSKNEIINILHESDSEAVVFSEAYAEMIFEHKSSLKRLRHLICMDDCKMNDSFLDMKTMIDETEPYDKDKLPEIDPEEMAEIIFTSGSLGRAKGVMLSQRNLASNLMDMVSMLMMYPTDRFMSVLPIHHTYECTCGNLCPLYVGASVHYARSLKTIVDDFQTVKTTIFLGVPLLYEKMFKRITSAIKEDKVKSKVVPAMVGITNFASKLGMSGLKKKIFKELHNRFGGHVRLFIVGGAAADPMVSKGLKEFGFNFRQGYGLTETSPILAVNRLKQYRDDAAGMILPNVELRINNPDEEGMGEIWAKGPNVMLGYYKNEELTKEVFEGDWFRTGDIGKITSDGFLLISGRKKNVIVSRGGKNIFPEEIEDILNRSPFVMESVVYGVEGDSGDVVITAQIVVDADAFVELSETEGVKITDELIHKYIDQEVKKTNKELTSFKKIKKFIIRESEFEKTTTQKIKRHLVDKKKPE